MIINERPPNFEQIRAALRPRYRSRRRRWSKLFRLVTIRLFALVRVPPRRAVFRPPLVGVKTAVVWRPRVARRGDGLELKHENSL